MKSPGTLLREAREELGLTLDDVGAMTRIPKAMLEHLEKDRFEEYVAEVFVRGHLRNYARELRLDVEKVLQAYERHTGRRRTDPMAEAQRAGRIAAGRARPRPIPSASAAAAARAEAPSTSSGTKFKFNVGGIRRSHVVAVFLVIVGLIMVGYLTSNRATAQDPADFPEVDESTWELDQDVQETRWLLERSDSEE